MVVDEAGIEGSLSESFILRRDMLPLFCTFLPCGGTSDLSDVASRENSRE